MCVCARGDSRSWEWARPWTHGIGVSRDGVGFAANAPCTKPEAAMGGLILGIVIVVLLVLIAFKSIHSIGALEVGLVSKRFGFKKLKDDDPVAYHGEAGYQAALLMPGLRFKLWPMFGVKKFPWVQVPAGEIGIVI